MQENKIGKHVIIVANNPIRDTQLYVGPLDRDKICGNGEEEKDWCDMSPDPGSLIVWRGLTLRDPQDVLNECYEFYKSYNEDWRKEDFTALEIMNELKISED